MPNPVLNFNCLEHSVAKVTSFDARRAGVHYALATSSLEGIVPSKEQVSRLQRYINGQATIEQLIVEAKAQYSRIG